MNIDFDEMVDDIYSNLTRTKSNSLKLPNNVIEFLPTKIYWKNVKDILDIINRDPHHFLDYIKNQYTNREIQWYSGDFNDGLIIHGKNLKNNDIINITHKYINTFVICSSCMSNDTIMTKSHLKKYNFICNNCKMNKYL